MTKEICLSIIRLRFKIIAFFRSCSLQIAKQTKEKTKNTLNENIRKIELRVGHCESSQLVARKLKAKESSFPFFARFWDSLL